MENTEAAKLLFKKLYKQNVQSRDDIKPRLKASKYSAITLIGLE